MREGGGAIFQEKIHQVVIYSTRSPEKNPNMNLPPGTYIVWSESPL